MKIKISDIEKRLGYKLRRNVYVLGVDTASITGLAIAQTDNKILDITTDIFKLPPVNAKDETSTKYVEKLECMLTLVREFRKKLKPKKESILVLENSFLGVNPVTFGILRMLGGIAFAELYDIFEHIHLVFPTTARKEAGFKSVLPRGTKPKDKKQEIVNWINNKFGTTETDDNIADAILLSLYGLKERYA